MKKDIHPKYFPNAKVTCSCGNTFEIGSTQEELKVEVCSACHPYYTGTSKFIDTAGRVDKFREKIKKAQEFKNQQKKKSR
jgi:large subunit ribosomal protein L31